MLDTGASHHIWNDKSQLNNFRTLTPEEAQQEDFLGIDGIILPEGVADLPIDLESDEGIIDHFLLNKVYYFPKSPTKIVVPQVFAQQRAVEGDLSAHCDVQADGLLLEWTSDTTHQLSSKFVPLSSSNVGIVCSAPKFNRFLDFAKCFRNFAASAIVSDNENNVSETNEPSVPPSVEPTSTEGQHQRTTPVTTNFSSSKLPVLIDSDLDPPLL